MQSVTDRQLSLRTTHTQDARPTATQSHTTPACDCQRRCLKLTDYSHQCHIDWRYVINNTLLQFIREIYSLNDHSLCGSAGINYLLQATVGLCKLFNFLTCTCRKTSYRSRDPDTSCARLHCPGLIKSNQRKLYFPSKCDNIAMW